MITRSSLFMHIARCAGVVLVSALLASGAIAYFGAQIRQLATQVVKQHELATSLQARSEAVTQVVAQYAAVAANHTRIEAALLPTNNALEFSDAYQSLATKDSVTESFNFAAPMARAETLGAPPQQVQGTDFSLTVQGNIFTFIQYLKDLEALPYFSSTRSITFTAPTSGGWRTTSNIGVSGTLYTLGD